MIKIKDFIKMPNDYTTTDILRIIKVCANHNIEITPSEAEGLWITYSDDCCANWLVLPDSDEYLFEIIIEQARKIYKGSEE